MNVLTAALQGLEVYFSARFAKRYIFQKELGRNEEGYVLFGFRV